MLNLFYTGVNKSHFEPVNSKDLVQLYISEFKNSNFPL